MSCSGCRVLRKGCSDVCVLRPSICWIDGSEAQGHATVFVAKFFGRAGLLSSLSSVPESHRPALFRSLLYEACGRTVSPITGAVGLLWTGNWDACEAAVDAVLRGKIPRPAVAARLDCELDALHKLETTHPTVKRRKTSQEASCDDLDLCLSSSARPDGRAVPMRQRAATPSDESGMTSAESGREHHHQFANREQPQLLDLFV